MSLLSARIIIDTTPTVPEITMSPIITLIFTTVDCVNNRPKSHKQSALPEEVQYS